MATTIDAVAAVTGRHRLRAGGLALADAAARVAIARAGLTAGDVELLVNTGLYHDRLLGEPALAALIQEDIGANPEDPHPGGHGTFSFDVANGGCGMLTGLQVVDGFLRAGTVQHAVVVASDASPGRRLARRFPYAPAGAAMVCGWHDGPGGLAGFHFATAPASGDGMWAATGQASGDDREIRATTGHAGSDGREIRATTGQPGSHDHEIRATTGPAGGAGMPAAAASADDARMRGTTTPADSHEIRATTAPADSHEIRAATAPADDHEIRAATTSADDHEIRATAGQAGGDGMRAATGQRGDPRLRIERVPDFEVRAGAWAAEVAAQLLDSHGIDPGAVDVVIANPLIPAFLGALAEGLGIDRARVVSGGGRDSRVHTAGLGVAWARALQDRRLTGGSTALLVSAGAGLTAGACLAHL